MNYNLIKEQKFLIGHFPDIEKPYLPTVFDFNKNDGKSLKYETTQLPNLCTNKGKSGNLDYNVDFYSYAERRKVVHDTVKLEEFLPKTGDRDFNLIFGGERRRTLLRKINLDHLL
jgi:hypothetical protein